MTANPANHTLLIFSSFPLRIRTIPEDDPSHCWYPRLRWAARTRKRRSKYYSVMNPMPFVIASSTLLTIFMIGIPRPYHRLGPGLPRSSYFVSLPGADRGDAIRVFLMRDGKIYYHNHQVNSNELPGQIRGDLRDGAGHRVYVAADSRARYREVKEVLDAL
jgi:biopolymer transport protein ExbD